MADKRTIIDEPPEELTPFRDQNKESWKHTEMEDVHHFTYSLSALYKHHTDGLTDAYPHCQTSAGSAGPSSSPHSAGNTGDWLGLTNGIFQEDIYL